jgi:23S rRNA pseudouridine2605 synthase
MSRTGLARALSKLGHCSRSQGALLVKAGRVRINGRVCRDPEKPVQLESDQLSVDEQPVSAARLVYLMLNKPRGLVTTRSDEQGRATVFDCLAGNELPPLSPVGRLDRASEGLLLFTNDHAWANAITDPESHLPKTYHVQVSDVVNDAKLKSLAGGAESEGEHLSLASVRVLRSGEKNTWLEIVLDEGRNRHIRRIMEAHQMEVLRLVRVAIGPLILGPLAKGAWRFLTATEVENLVRRENPTP